MKQRPKKIPPQGEKYVGEALNRVIEEAEATDNAKEAKLRSDEKAKQGGQNRAGAISPRTHSPGSGHKITMGVRP